MNSPRKRSRKTSIDLTEFEDLAIVFKGKNGKELLNISFSRTIEDTPSISINVVGPSGETKHSSTIFDCEA